MNVKTLSYLIHQSISRKLTEAEYEQLDGWLQGTSTLQAKNTSEPDAIRQGHICFN